MKKTSKKIIAGKSMKMSAKQSINPAAPAQEFEAGKTGTLTVTGENSTGDPQPITNIQVASSNDAVMTVVGDPNDPSKFGVNFIAQGTADLNATALNAANQPITGSLSVVVIPAVPLDVHLKMNLVGN